jgi:hypothetical protein
LKNDDYVKRRTLTFIKNYSDFLRDPDFVMVWLDESYIHVNYGRTKTWSGPKGSDAYFTTQPENIGQRVMIIHAITHDGILHCLDDEHIDEKVRSNPCAPLLSAEALWTTAKNDDDYHKSMDGSVFIDYMRNRVIPAFSHKYPGKRMVLILDNAKYHHVRGEHFINVNTMDKSSLIDLLKIKANISIINVTRDGLTKQVMSESWNGHRHASFRTIVA